MLDRIGLTEYHHVFFDVGARASRASVHRLLRHAQSIGASTNALIGECLSPPYNIQFAPDVRASISAGGGLFLRLLLPLYTVGPAHSFPPHQQESAKGAGLPL